MPGRGSPRRAAGLLAAALGVACAIGTACIIAEPPTNLPVPQTRRPTIVRDRVEPPASGVLGVFPTDGFIVFVDVDPTTGFDWRIFVDYDPLNPSSSLKNADRVPPDPGASEGGLVRVTMAVSPPSLDQCHVIEALVGTFANTNDQHTFDDANGGGDSISWIYSPSGDLRGCPIVDAGIDGAFPVDSSSETSPVAPLDGGTE